MKNALNNRKRLIVLVGIMAFIALVVGGVAIIVLYETAFEEKRQSLVQTAKIQARLIEAVARFDSQYSQFDHPEGAFAATLDQISDAHTQYGGLGVTGEFTLARVMDDQIVFLLRLRHSAQVTPKPVPLDSSLAEPMRNALMGRSGSLIGPDYRGEMVLAAYEPVAVLNLGIVAKIDLSEIRLPFIRAGGEVAVLSMLLISIGATLFFKVSSPMIRRINESEKRLEEIARMASDRFWEMDENFRFTSFTELKDEFPIEPHYHIGITRWKGAGVDPDEDEKWGRHRDDHQAHRPYSNFEYTMIKDGETLFLSTSGTPIFDAAGNFKGYHGSATDLTARKRTEAELLEAEEQARRSQKMEAVGQLTGGIAHDFNNILGIVMGNLEILERLAAGDENLLDRISKTSAAAKRGADLTQKLLGFSRKEARETSPVLVNEIVLSMDELLTKSLTVTVNITHYLADDLWLTEVDPGDLQDAILNLSINAHNAMPDGGALVIETANKVLDENYVEQNPGSTAGEYVMLSFGDTGAGMTEEVKEKALEPFFTTKEAGQGSGLGLSMVYGFIRRSGGHIHIYSEPGKGTTVRLYLPRVLEDLENHDKGNIETGIPCGDETILVVDDEEALAEIAVIYLNDLGYKTLTASSGMQALRVLAENGDIDLLFSDVIMPGDMDGYQLAVEAQKNQPSLKVLLSSGFTRKKEETSNGDGPRYAELARCLLTKPYDKAELATAIRKALDVER